MGVAIVALASGTGEVRWSPGAVGWGLLSGAMYALYFLVGRRLFSRNASARVMAWALGVGAATMLPFVPFQALSRSAWGGVAYAGGAAGFFNYAAMAYVNARTSPVTKGRILTQHTGLPPRDTTACTSGPSWAAARNAAAAPVLAPK